jgi:AcrR family transcriptional regulator
MDAKTKPLSIREEVSALKRERTVREAVALFYEKGYGNTTLDEVAERLSVTKPFIYANFGSKAELLAEICGRGVRAAGDALDEVLAFDLGPRDTLRLFLRRYVAAILTHQREIAIYTREEKNLAPADAGRLAEGRRGFVAKLAGILADGVRAGEFEVDDPSLAALAIVGAVSWSTFWYHPDGRLGIDEITETMTRHLMGMTERRRA